MKLPPNVEVRHTQSEVESLNSQLATASGHRRRDLQAKLD